MHTRTHSVLVNGHITFNLELSESLNKRNGLAAQTLDFIDIRLNTQQLTASTSVAAPFNNMGFTFQSVIWLVSVGVVGKLGDAEALLDRVIELGVRPGRQPNVGAYVARGTARALTRSLAGAPP